MIRSHDAKHAFYSCVFGSHWVVPYIYIKNCTYGVSKDRIHIACTFSVRGSFFYFCFRFFPQKTFKEKFNENWIDKKEKKPPMYLRMISLVHQKKKRRKKCIRFSACFGHTQSEYNMWNIFKQFILYACICT